MAELKIGDSAPRFSLPNQDGTLISLDDFIGKKAIVVYFYPKDETPGCTKEACSFRDSYEQFMGAGAEVIGISFDSESSHKKFASKYRLPFSLLSDRRNKVRKSYGVKAGLMGLLPGRETFVIDKKGVIRHRFASQFQIDSHIDDALEVVKNLASEDAA